MLRRQAEIVTRSTYTYMHVLRNLELEISLRVLQFWLSSIDVLESLDESANAISVCFHFTRN